MTTLRNFPMVSQLTTITSDGRPSEDAQFECVPSSIGAGMLWYEGKHQWDASLNPDLMKDKVYGEAWVNDGTAAIRYVPFCAARGFKLFSIDGNPASLVQQARTHIQAEHPVIFTEVDPYCSVYQRDVLGWTHVCVFFEEGAGFLTAMDPYIARAIEHSDSEWEALMRFNQIWILERSEVDVPPIIIDLHHPDVAAHFAQVGTTWQCKTTGKNIHGLILDFYTKFGNYALNGLTRLGLPLSDEIPLPETKHNATMQRYETADVFYDPGHEYDIRPGAPNDIVYLGKIYEGPGVDPRIAELQVQVDTLKQQLAAQPPVPPASDVQQRLDVAIATLAKITALAQVTL